MSDQSMNPNTGRGLTGEGAQGGAPLAPGQWLGMLGGGQLGRMFCHAAQALGYRVAVLDPAEDSPAGAVADLHIASDYTAADGLERLMAVCPAVTTEFENVPAESLRLLAGQCRVSPSGDAVAPTQDRITEKAFIVSQGIAVAPHAVIRRAEDVENAPEALFPGILKLARLGYDGKGQARIDTRQDALEAFRAFGALPCVLEARLPLAYELSIVVGRGLDGAVACYPVSRNEHRDGILAVSVAPAPGVSTELAAQVAATAEKIAHGLNYHGVLCVEFFVLRDGSLVVNEIAPRPHNSGHFTIDACVSSQFEQQARILAGMPLGSTQVVQPSVMLNILGDVWFDEQGRQREPDWASVLAVPGAKLHLYGKREARKGRKMGHVTCLGATLAQAHATARDVGAVLGIAMADD